MCGCKNDDFLHNVSKEIESEEGKRLHFLWKHNAIFDFLPVGAPEI